MLVVMREMRLAEEGETNRQTQSDSKKRRLLVCASCFLECRRIVGLPRRCSHYCRAYSIPQTNITQKLQGLPVVHRAQMGARGSLVYHMASSVGRSCCKEQKLFPSPAVDPRIGADRLLLRGTDFHVRGVIKSVLIQHCSWCDNRH